MKLITFEFDTCVSVISYNGQNIINPDGDNDERWFLECLAHNGVKYEIIDPFGPGGEWPIIQFTGTSDQLFPVIELLDAYGRELADIKSVFRNWDGSQLQLENIIC